MEGRQYKFRILTETREGLSAPLEYEPPVVLSRPAGTAFTSHPNSRADRNKKILSRHLAKGNAVTETILRKQHKYTSHVLCTNNSVF